MAAWKKAGVPKPSALAIGVVLDTQLNTGIPKISDAVHGDEIKTLEAYCDWKIKISGKNEYNDPPENGTNRGKMYKDLLRAKCFSLKDCDAQLKKAMSWNMK